MRRSRPGERLAVRLWTGAMLLFVSTACQNPIVGVTAAPTFSRSSGTYPTAQWVTITNNTRGAAIHYTTDGSTPTASSPVAAGPIVVAGEGVTKTIRAIALGGIWGGSSPVASVSLGIAFPPMNPAGTVTTLAGSTLAGSSNGTGTSASFYNPEGPASDGSNLYVADWTNNLIRAIGPGGVVTTLAGGAGATSAGHADGIGTASTFNGPAGITTDGSNLYVADSGNNLIRKVVIATGAVTTLAGGGSPGATASGSANGSGTSATFNGPYGITTDGMNLYVADSGNNLIRKVVIATAAVTTLAGGGSPGGTASGHADGIGTRATFSGPIGITTDGTNLYVADYSNNLIRKVVIATGAVSTLAGGGGQGGTASGHANGTGAAATFYWPFGITTDGTNLYVADSGNNLIRKIVIATGAVTTLAGGGSPGGTATGSADGTGTTATFNGPYGITTDGTTVYVADSSNNMIRTIR